MPTRAKTLTTSAAVILFFIGVLSVFLHIFDATKFPSPQSLETDILIGLSLITIFGLYFPWSRIKFGDWEIEAKVQKELNDREDVIASLAEQLSDVNNEVENENALETLQTEQSGVDDLARHSTVSLFSENEKQAVLNFFKAWPNSGFNFTRIVKWGAKQPGHEDLKNLSSLKMRTILSTLTRDGVLRLRLSKNGNVLYQINPHIDSEWQF